MPSIAAATVDHELGIYERDPTPDPKA